MSSILTEAAALIDGERRHTYGDPRDSFNRIAGLWTAYLGTTVTALDVANMMILLKMSRTKGAFHRDSYVDTAGYAALAERIDCPHDSLSGDDQGPISDLGPWPDRWRCDQCGQAVAQ